MKLLNVDLLYRYRVMLKFNLIRRVLAGNPIITSQSCTKRVMHQAFM